MNNDMQSEFLQHLSLIKDSAKKEIDQYRMAENYQADVHEIITLLNHSLATEIICVHRYKKNFYTATSLGEAVIGNEFLQHANEEQDHADRLAKRISQLGGEPEYNPAIIIKTSHVEYKDCQNVQEMLVENLASERIAIAVYREIIQYVNHKDPVTRRLLEDILGVEEDHARDLIDFLNRLDKDKEEFTNEKIQMLRQQAADLAMKMIAEEENMRTPVTTSEADINEIVGRLNAIDKKKVYTISDFLPKV